MRSGDDASTAGFSGGGAEDDLVLVVSLPSGVIDVPLAGKRTVSLGRAPTCDVHLDDASVSREHVVLTTKPLMITDMGSRNGTSLGGKALEAEISVPIALGDTFTMGNVTAFIRSVPAATSGAIRAPVTPSDVVLDDARTREVYAQLDLIAPSMLSVLVLGETGVGKEVYAQELHRRSNRRGALLQLNCAALPESILEGELFGYERGAFTGAVQAKAGLFEAASDGTIFLDEVGELPLGTQAKLLRVLESGEILRLGARKAIKVDVRFISATHRDLEAMVAAGTFRRDLYYRVCGVSVTLPALRDRSDLLAIAEAFLTRTGKTVRFSPAAKQALGEHDWPGNVRELKNVVERAAVLARGAMIEPHDLGLRPTVAAIRGPAATIPPDGHAGQALPTILPVVGDDTSPGLTEGVRNFEREQILSALAKTNGNKTQAAKLLGISRYALLYRLRELGVDK